MYSSNLHLNQLPLPQNKGTFILHNPPKHTSLSLSLSPFSSNTLFSQRVRECEVNKRYKTDWNLSFSPSICRMDCFRSCFLLCLILSSRQGRGEEMVPAVHFVNFPLHRPTIYTHHIYTHTHINVCRHMRRTTLGQKGGGCWI